MRRHRLILAGIIVVLAFMALPPARQLFEQRERIASERMKLQALMEENQRLEQRLERLNDPDYLEKLAREQLGLVRPGEVSYVLVPEENPEEEQNETETARHWYQRIWDRLVEVLRDG